MFSKILGTGSYTPERVCTNDDLAQVVDTSDSWIRERTGICQRHIASSDETVVFMGQQAALKALEAAHIAADDLDMIIVATTSAQHAFPSVASQVQHLLMSKNIPAFDVAAACSGFTYALSVADQFVKTGAAKNVLVIGVDALSQLCNPSDRSTLVLFGDGAGAMVIGASQEPGILSTHISSNGAHNDLLKCGLPARPHQDAQDSCYIEMKGNEVFRVAVSHLSEMVKKALAQHNMTHSDLDWLVPHQANLRIIKATAKKLNIGLDKVVVTVDQHGNTSAASVPLALDIAIRDGRIQRGQTILLEAFGSGFVWGSALIQY